MKQNFTVRQGALDGIETFLAVAKQRSFRRAAAALGVSPSAISQAVRALEGRIGAALLVRTTRSVGLTEAGHEGALKREVCAATNWADRISAFYRSKRGAEEHATA